MTTQPTQLAQRARSVISRALSVELGKLEGKRTNAWLVMSLVMCGLSLVIILRLIGMSVSMSSMMAYGLRRTTVLGREMLGPDDALDLEKTARVALDVVTKITSEIALISLAVTAMALGVALLLRRSDVLSHP